MTSYAAPDSRLMSLRLHVCRVSCVCRVCVFQECRGGRRYVPHAGPGLGEAWGRGPVISFFDQQLPGGHARATSARRCARHTRARYHTRTHFINALAQNGTQLVQRMQFHLQKPCAVRVGSELDYVAFADIQRVLPRITLGTGTPQLYVYMHYVYMC